jgi:hypothetical protein
MATVDKNFRVKNGLVVEGTIATVNGDNILVQNTTGDQYILNLVGGATLVKSVDAGTFTVDGSGNLTINSGVFDASGSATTAENNAKSYADGLAINYDSAGSATTAYNNATSYTDTAILNLNLGSTYDAYGSASSAQTAAQNYADGLINALGGNVTAVVNGHLDVMTGTGITVNNNAIEVDFTELDTHYDSYGSASNAQTAAQNYADTAATNAENAAKGYADSLINDASTTTTNVWSAYKTSSEIGVAVSNLVDSAPALLDTLNELAAALADNPNYATDMASQLSAKQNNLTAGTGITLLNDEISVTANTYDAYGAAASAETAAKAYADGLAPNYDAAGSAALAQSAAELTALNYVGDVLNGTSPFTELNISDESKQIAASVTSLGSVTATAYQFNKSSWKAGKFTVKIDNGTNTEISEILLTTDSSGNIAITEYAIVGTNGPRGTITADADATYVRVRVTPVDDSTIKIIGTILK